MTRKTVHALIAIIVGLVLLLFVMQRVDREEIVVSRDTLLPDLQAVADDLTKIRVARPGGDEGVTLHRKDGQWVVGARDDYPADLAKLKPLIIALAYARNVEEKTSNPDQYDRLGLNDPEDGGKGTKVVLSAPNVSYSVILGNTAQRDSRYARVSDEATSYLIDRNPDLPDSVGDWLLPDIVDIPAGSVRRVVIAHADEETITIEKTDQEQTDFDIADVPEGRELSYATVGNGVAGAIAGLELDDVRARIEAPVSTTTSFETWDGIELVAEIVAGDDDSDWVSFTARIAVTESAAGEQVAAINERVAGWQYQLPEFKKNLLTRRWDDVLKSQDDSQ